MDHFKILLFSPTTSLSIDKQAFAVRIGIIKITWYTTHHHCSSHCTYMILEKSKNKIKSKLLCHPCVQILFFSKIWFLNALTILSASLSKPNQRRNDYVTMIIVFIFVLQLTLYGLCKMSLLHSEAWRMHNEADFIFDLLTPVLSHILKDNKNKRWRIQVIHQVPKCKKTLCSINWLLQTHSVYIGCHMQQ
jgi:hypothetical protein